MHTIQYTPYIVENTSHFRDKNHLVNTVTGNVDVCSENRKNPHINTECGQDSRIIKVNTGVTYKKLLRVKTDPHKC